jgi:L-arabinokinase
MIGDAHAWIARRRDFFARGSDRPVLVARAPGRLDVMGGIADYSGSLVLEMPLALTTWVAVQVDDDGADAIIIETEAAAAGDPGRRVIIPLAELVPPEPLDYARARALLTGDPARAWSAYVAGALVVMHRLHGRPLRRGIRVLIRSDVPVGGGVSSSAALGVAAFDALAALAGVAVDDRQLALAAQMVENLVVGAPCGIMDQMTAACGRRDQLLALLCQPAEIIGHQPLPPGLAVHGIDSGIRHAVTGGDYASVRTAAFMGYRIVAAAAGLTARSVGTGRVAIDDQIYDGYLANVPPAVWSRRFRDTVPAELDGAAFLARYQGSTDTVTAVDPARTYAVRAATEHPIYEHARAGRFRDILAGGAASGEARAELGELMFASHASYAACGLGSEGTDRLVELARAAGPGAGVYGAKVTGGGSGGTVAVLAAAGRRAVIDAIAERYRAETGHQPTVFSDSSDGARAAGLQRIMP